MTLRAHIVSRLQDLAIAGGGGAVGESWHKRCISERMSRYEKERGPYLFDFGKKYASPVRGRRGNERAAPGGLPFLPLRHNDGQGVFLNGRGEQNKIVEHFQKRKHRSRRIANHNCRSCSTISTIAELRSVRHNSRAGCLISLAPADPAYPLKARRIASISAANSKSE